MSREPDPSTRMWKPSWPPAGAPGPSLVLLLLTSLVLSGVLAYQAQDAARSHRAASESALRDYAALASEEMARHLDDEMEDLARVAMNAPFDAERRESGPGRLPEFVEEVREEDGRCDCPERLHDFFLLDLRDGSMEMRETTLSAADRGWIVEAVRATAGDLRSFDLPRDERAEDPRELPERLGQL
jgi:hypothetical protein